MPGYKTWNTGDVLTAADIMDFLMKQGVPTFVNATARDAAIAAPRDGQIADLQDTDRLTRYTGAAWRFITPYRDFNLVGSAVPSVTFSSIPSTIRTLRLTGTARSSNAALLADVRFQVGGDTGSNYHWQSMFAQNGSAPSSASQISGTSALISYCPAASGSAGVWGAFEATFSGWDQSTHALGWCGGGGYTALAGECITNKSDGQYFGVNARTSLTLIPSAGNWATGTQFTIEGWE